MVMFLLSFVKGSKSPEGGPNSLADMDGGSNSRGSKSARTPALSWADLHGTIFVPCILKHVLKCMRQKSYCVNRPFQSFYNVLYTLSLFVRRHRLLERGIYTFPCLFVCTGSYNEGYTLSLVCLSAQAPKYTHFCFSAQAFRTRRTHFPHFPCFFVGTGF